MALREKPHRDERRPAAPGEAPHARYDELVARSPQGSIFSTSWWLDAVAPARWRSHAVQDGDRLVAAWPTVVTRTAWGDVHSGAPLTPFLGPLFDPGESSQRRRSREIEYLELLLGLLEPFAHVDARCHPAFDYWTPLRWHGFAQTTHYTWRLPDLGDLEAVFAGTRENVRREVRKARKHGIAVADGALEDLLRLHADAGVRQGRRDEVRANSEVIRQIARAGSDRGAVEILLARDADGALHSGGFFVHDRRYTYYLLGATETRFRTSGAASLVMWEAIERAAARGTGFDFEGSMLRPVERFMRAFGGVPTPYSIVRKTPSLGFRSSRALKRIAREAIGVLRARDLGR